MSASRTDFQQLSEEKGETRMLMNIVNSGEVENMEGEDDEDEEVNVSRSPPVDEFSTEQK